MRSQTALFVGLWCVNLAVGVGAGFVLANHRAQRSASPCHAAQSTPCAMRERTIAPAATRVASDEEAPLAPLVVGASSWSEPNAPTATNARRMGSITHPETGDPLPPRSAVNSRCVHSGLTRFLGREPHVPLATFDGRELRSVDAGCGASWSAPAARWRALDSWGQLVGHAVTSGGEGYAVTQSYELALTITDGTSGAGLYVSEDSPWTATPSAEWAPSAAQRELYQRFLGRFSRLFREQRASNSEEDRRSTMFFRASSGSNQAFFAVTAGRSLMISRFDATRSQWGIVTLHTAQARSASGNSFALEAVFDADHDGWPEIFVHHDEHDAFWNDAIFSTHNEGNSWAIEIASFGGSTA